MINQLKQARAITLIALIITIIVMLILAGVVINMTLGNDGIIAKAQGAVDAYKNAQEKEEIELAKAEEIINNRGMVMVDETEYNALIATVNNINSNFQSETGSIAISSSSETTLKSFTNLSPGLYFVSYSQMFPYSSKHGLTNIRINGTSVVFDDTADSSTASQRSCSSGIVQVNNTTDIITLNYESEKTTTSADRSYSWQIIRLR